VVGQFAHLLVDHAGDDRWIIFEVSCPYEGFDRRPFWPFKNPIIGKYHLDCRAGRSFPNGDWSCIDWCQYPFFSLFSCHNYTSILKQQITRQIGSAVQSMLIYFNLQVLYSKDLTLL
jgi:hypothetical protein